MQQHQRDVGAHLLAQAELPRQGMEELADAEQLLDEAEHPLVTLPRDLPYHALPLEAGRHRLVPPQLGALAEHHADAPHVPDALLEGVHAEAAHGAGGGASTLESSFTVVDLPAPLGPA